MVSVTNPKPTNPTVLKSDGSGNDIQQWQNSNGVSLASIKSSGLGKFNSAGIQASALNLGGFQNTTPNGSISPLRVQSEGTTYLPLMVKGAASQTADLQQWQDSAGNVISRITSLGRMYVDTPNTGFEVRNGGSSKVGLDVRGIIYFDPSNEQTTIGAAGTAAALPAAPTKYLRVVDSAGTILAIPAYASA